MRNYKIDTARGFTILSMIFFHLCYNINLYQTLPWYDGTILNKVWQLSIAISFFLISGITSNFLSSRKIVNKGGLLTVLGILITILTLFSMTGQVIRFGVLNGLGASMLIGGGVKKHFRFNKFHAILFFLLFILTYTWPQGHMWGLPMPEILYESGDFFFLGFPGADFESVDYFPIFPWTFLYFTGMGIGDFLREQGELYSQGRENILSKIGQHSLLIYLLHQVILYPLVTWLYQ